VKQSKLEEKVEKIFKEQGFSLEKNENKYSVSSQENRLELGVYSSEKYSQKQVEESSRNGENVFVDEELSEIKGKISNDVSVLKEEEENSEDLSIPSYERIGDVVVISELDDISKQEAVDAVLEHNPGINSIILKKDKLSGEFRIGGYETIYGEGTETVHKEHGTRIKVDPTEMFFSEREGTERKRIFESVQDGERVLVMFCGAGPFPTTIGRNADPEKVVGVEKNPEAVKYACENVEINNLSEKVEILQGDVKDVCPDLGCFDRVLMPSPTNSLEFVEEAINSTCENGFLVVYSIQDKENLYYEVIDVVKDKAEEKGRTLKVLEKRVVSDFSPAKRKVAVEFKIS